MNQRRPDENIAVKHFHSSKMTLEIIQFLVDAGDVENVIVSLNQSDSKISEAERAATIAAAYRNRAALLKSVAEKWRAQPEASPVRTLTQEKANRDSDSAEQALSAAAVYEEWALAAQSNEGAKG